MGFFSKIKNATSNALANRAGNEIAKKIEGKPSTSCSSSYSSHETKHDAAHEAKVEAMRKENELRSLELERQMQDAGLRMANAAADSMETTNQILEEQNKKKKGFKG